MPKATSHDLLFVAKAPKERLDVLAAGASLVRRSGYEVEQLRIKVTLDRVSFARTLLKSAEAARDWTPPMNRVAVSRGYYSMYHALRAASFFRHGGDDFEQHLVLPTKLPRDFPNVQNWENTLKGARYERNRADYDPYPRNEAQFEQTANQVISDANALIPVVRRYLRQKGCVP